MKESNKGSQASDGKEGTHYSTINREHSRASVPLAEGERYSDPHRHKDEKINRSA